MDFYVGLHQPSDARHFDLCCISVKRLLTRRRLTIRRWLMDSGAFTEIAQHGGYRHDVKPYASEIRRFSGAGKLDAAVAQDYMCESQMLKKTGLTIPDHQRLTIERYDALRDEDTGGVYVMPVIQGYSPVDYRRHLTQYGDRLAAGQWVGVGSVCKRNGRVEDVVAVLAAIGTDRPDLRLHGFGLKQTAIMDGRVRALLHSADSMAWSFAARWEGRNRNDWREAAAYAAKVNAAAAGDTEPWQAILPLR